MGKFLAPVVEAAAPACGRYAKGTTNEKRFFTGVLRGGAQSPRWARLAVTCVAADELLASLAGGQLRLNPSPRTFR